MMDFLTSCSSLFILMYTLMAPTMATTPALGNLGRHRAQGGRACRVVACGVLGECCGRPDQQHEGEHLQPPGRAKALHTLSEFFLKHSFYLKKIKHYVNCLVSSFHTR